MKNILFVIGVSAVFLMACTDSGNQQASETDQQSDAQTSKPAAKPVKFIILATHSNANNEALPGRVRAYKTAEIRPQVSGIIEEILFQQGSRISQGQQLYQIDSAQYEADYQSAKARLQNAEAELNIAEVLQKRYQNLIKSNAISEQELDNASASVAQTKAAVALAQAELKRTEINLHYTKVYAPISGYIGPSTITQGALVAAQQSTALATIRQLDPVFVDISQSALALPLLKRGLAAMGSEQKEPQLEVTLLVGKDASIYEHKGKLFATDLAVNENTGTITLRTLFPNPDAILLPGMFVEAKITNSNSQALIMVPQKAVTIEPDGSKSVWVLSSDKRANKRVVKIGSSYQNNWIIEDGLSAGEKVIIEGIMMLQEGTKVDPQTSESAN